MKNTFTTLGFCALMAGSTQAAYTFLNLPLSGTYNGGETVVTSITNTDGGTFDVTYTLGLTGNPSDPDPATTALFIESAGDSLGVGGGSDTNARTGTIEGDTSQGISFTSLTVSNFVMGTTYTEAEITNSLTFTGFTAGAGPDGQDNANISFGSFGVDTQSVSFNNATNAANSTANGAYSIESLSNFSTPATDLFIQASGANSKNRFSITGLQVNFIPEPSAFALVGFGFAGLLMRRRRI
ncbi:PEP-CTERM sorting domain-containing protein [Luteolibacter sp. AS25]|uniref:PEP-CTERM sorting domain-containing protein n=1 Tax=Luteolibacter sp. AS25 TaxID=3135776 RepID=UPI00398B8DF6